jgi:hypothetical protein
VVVREDLRVRAQGDRAPGEARREGDSGRSAEVSRGLPPYASRMKEPVQQRAPGWYRRSIVAALVAAIGIPAVNGALWVQQGPAARPGESLPAQVAPAQAAPAQAAPAQAAPAQAAPAPTHVQSGTSSTPSTAAVLDLLHRRSQAVVSADRSAWLATVDARVPGLAQRQAQLFDRLVQVRPAAWTYRLLPPDATLPAHRQAALGPSAFLAHVRLAYRLVADAGEVEREQHLTLVRQDGTWLVGGDEDGTQQRDVWDLSAIRVSRSRRSIVVAARAASVPAARTATEADGAARRVDAVWGTSWPRTVVVLVPASPADMATMLDRTSTKGLSQLAAVTTGELRTPETGDVAGGRTTGDRVVVNPEVFSRLTSLGRGVVLTHEFTHVATRAVDASAPPVWVDEGFADYVAYLGTPLAPRDIAGDLLDDAKALARLRELPRDVDFDPTAGHVGTAYAAAWLAMQFVAQRGGTAMAVDFYRVAAGLKSLRTWPSPPPPRASLAPRTPLERACLQVVGYLEPSFVRRWLVYVRTRAGA